jgi:NitT/TauT family transport system substrate-binding protein
MKRRTAITTLAALAAAGAAGPVRAQQSLPKLTVFTTASDPSGAVFYAKDLHTFEKHGLDVTINVANESSLAVSSVVSGTVQIGYTNIISIEQAYRKGLAISLIAPAAVNDYKRPTNWIVVPNNSPLKTMLDLQGKVVGTAPLKSLGDFSTNAWVDTHGGDSSKIKWVEMPYVACGPAMEQGRIDAAFLIEPYATNFRATTRKLGWPYEAIGKHFLGGGYFCTQTWAAANPDLVQRFAAAIIEASAWGNRNPSESAPIIEKYAHVDADTLAQIHRAVYGTTLSAAEVQPTIDFAAKFKFIDSGFNAADLIYKHA